MARDDRVRDLVSVIGPERKREFTTEGTEGTEKDMRRLCDSTSRGAEDVAEGGEISPSVALALTAS